VASDRNAVATFGVLEVRKRTTIALVVAQLFGGLGLTAGVTVGGIIAADLAGGGASGLPLAASVAGSALGALGLGALMHRRGRRAGLRMGWLVGAVGAGLAVLAVATGSLALLLTAMSLFGGGEAASAASRYAAADLPGAGGATMGIVLSATAISTITGPLLLAPTGHLAGALGLPVLVGPFLLAATAFTLAATVTAVALRPDPLIVARQLAPRPETATAPSPGPIVSTLTQARVGRGLAALFIANLVMLGIMTAAPVHLSHTGTLPTGIGLVLSLHLAGMYAPSPASGWLADRIGGRQVIVLGGLTLAIAGGLVVQSGTHGSLAAALLLLGVGWNLAYVGGSVEVTAGTRAIDRPRVQAAADAAMGVAGMTGSTLSGVVLATRGLTAIGVAGVMAATALVAIVVAPRRAPWRQRYGHGGTRHITAESQDQGCERAEAHTSPG
jgi:MFS family permease